MANLPTIEYDQDRTEYLQAAEAGGIIGKGFAGYLWLCHAAGYIQMAAGRRAASSR